jgi:excinuclease ABC subunit C
MDAAAEAQRYEAAALHRDRLAAVRSLMERQRVAGDSVGTADLVAVAAEGTDANAQVFQVRDGVLAERQSFYLDNRAERDEGEVAEEFITQYYLASPVVPRLVVVGPELREQVGVLSEALTERRGGTVEVRVAERGDKRRLRELAQRNAKLALGEEKLRRERSRRQRVDSLAALADALALDEMPVRIEGFDVSNLGAEHTVASMVVFEGGAPKKAHYRRFKIRWSERDDYAAIEEVLSRRVSRYVQQADLSPHEAERDASFASLPSLVVIDGGKGQLAAGMRELERLREHGTVVIGLAKRIEEVFVPGRSDPLPIPRDSEALKLLQRVRDEAHRFALDFHRERRSRAMTRSIFDELRGVGPVRRQALLAHFGTPERFMAASREDLEAVPGIPGKVARDLHGQLNKAG